MKHPVLKTLLIGGIITTTAGAAMAEEWNVSLWGKRRALTEHIEKLAELVSQKTDGEFTLNLSYGGLSKEKENLDGISIGAFEMAQFCVSYHPDKTPTLTVLDLPYLAAPTIEQQWAVEQAVYTHPAVVEDLAQWNATLLLPTPLPPVNVAGMGSAPASLADLEGLAVRASGGAGDVLKAAGAIPTSMPATEVSQSLDSGVIKAVAFHPHAMMSFNILERADWWTTNLDPANADCPVVVNSDALAALSDEHRAALEGSVDEAVQYYIDNYKTQTFDRFEAMLEDEGIERVTFDEAELEELRAEVEGSIAEEWIETNSSRGIPAQELYDLVVSTGGTS